MGRAKSASGPISGRYLRLYFYHISYEVKVLNDNTTISFNTNVSGSQNQITDNLDMHIIKLD